MEIKASKKYAGYSSGSIGVWHFKYKDIAVGISKGQAAKGAEAVPFYEISVDFGTHGCLTSDNRCFVRIYNGAIYANNSNTYYKQIKKLLKGTEVNSSAKDRARVKTFLKILIDLCSADEIITLMSNSYNSGLKVGREKFRLTLKDLLDGNDY